MAKKKVANRTVVDTSNVVIEDGVEVPPMLQGSKYPWNKIIDGEGRKSFFIPMESEEQANSLRSSIQQSGRSYYAKRKLPLRAVCRVMQSADDDTWGVRAWAFPTESNGDGGE